MREEQTKDPSWWLAFWRQMQGAYGVLDPVLLQPHFRFPLPPGQYRFDRDTFGEERTWNPDGERPRRHQGNDILAARGTDVLAVGPGRVQAMEWSEYGGWTVLLGLAGTPYCAYYSHLDGFAPGLRPGAVVAAGDVLGYVGDTGYGPPGTKGQFWPHLHFELRRGCRGEAVNPYPYLRLWEAMASR